MRSKRRLTRAQYLDLRRVAATGSLDEAREHVSRASETAPNDPFLSKLSGIVAYREERFRNAALHFTTCLSSGECDAEALLYLARSLYNLNDNDACKTAVESYLTIAPDTPDALRMLARVSARLGDIDGAEANWRKLARAKSDDAEAPLQVARLAARRGDDSTALEYATEAHCRNPTLAESLVLQAAAATKLRYFDTIPSVLVALMKVDQRRAATALTELGRHHDVGALEAAGRTVAAMRNAGELDTEMATLVKVMEQSWRVEAIQAELARDDKSASRFLRALQQASPHDTEVMAAFDRVCAHANAALQTAMRERDHSATIAAADELIELNPQLSDAFLAKGRALLVLGKNELALRPLEQAVELRPESAWYLLNLARVTWRLGQYARAAEFAQRTLVCDNDLTPQHSEEARALRSKACSHLTQGGLYAIREQDLRSAFKAATSLDRCGETHAANELRVLALRELHGLVQQEFRDGLPTTRNNAELYLSVDPGNVGILLILGRVLMRAADYEAALPIWLRLANAQPMEAHFSLQISRCYRRLGDHARAVEAAQQALTLDPSLTEAKDIATRSSAEVQATQSVPAATSVEVSTTG